MLILAGEIVGRFSAAGVAIDALVVDVLNPGHVIWPLLLFVRHGFTSINKFGQLSNYSFGRELSWKSS